MLLRTSQVARSGRRPQTKWTGEGGTRGKPSADAYRAANAVRLALRPTRDEPDAEPSCPKRPAATGAADAVRLTLRRSARGSQMRAHFTICPKRPAASEHGGRRGKPEGQAWPRMTLYYLEITQQDLQREYRLAHSNPRHLAPPPRVPASISLHRADLASLIDSLRAAQHVLEIPPQRC